MPTVLARVRVIINQDRREEAMKELIALLPNRPGRASYTSVQPGLYTWEFYDRESAHQFYISAQHTPGVKASLE